MLPGGRCPPDPSLGGVAAPQTPLHLGARIRMRISVSRISVSVSAYPYPRIRIHVSVSAYPHIRISADPHPRIRILSTCIISTKIHPCCTLRTPSDIVFDSLFNHGYHPIQPSHKYIYIYVFSIILITRSTRGPPT